MYYPLFMQLSTAHCLLVGAGAVGLRKARTLLAAHPASLLVLDVAAPSAEWEALRAHPALRLETRPFTPEDVQGCSLVFACTGNREVNARVAQACRERGILCNCADAPEEGSFIVPATARATLGGTAHGEGQSALLEQSEELMAALSTGGGSPAWAKVLREELEEWLTPRVPMTVLLTRLRPLVLALSTDTGQNTALFRTLVRSPLRHALAQGDAQACRQHLREALPDALHPHISELLYDLI